MNRRLKTFSLLLMAGLLALAGELGAVDLYTGEAPILDESDQGRKLAMGKAFRQMLVKVTGSEAVADHPALAGEIAGAEAYLLSYGYRDLTLEGIALRRLQARFSKEQVEQALDRLGIPVWRSPRPPVTLWVAREDGGERRLLQPGLDDEPISVLEDAFNARGLSAVLPLMDLEDRARLSGEDVWAGKLDAVRAASQRYAGTVMLVGRLHPAPGGLWQGDWTLLDGPRTLSWSNAAGGFAVATREAVGVVADKLAENYAPRVAAIHAVPLRIRVENIRNAGDFSRIDRLFSSLGSVVDGMVQLAEPNALSYRLKVRGGTAQLERELAASGFLEPQPAGGPASEAGEASLYYRIVY